MGAAEVVRAALASRGLQAVRTAVVNWTDRRVGGAEAYLARIMPALRASGHDVLLWHEQNGPDDRASIAGPDLELACSAEEQGMEAALTALRGWHPDVLFVHGLVNPDHERALLAIAPAVFFAHNYYGTCITGAKTTCFPSIRPCSRRFGPACLAHFYPNRCGGLNPLTALTEFRRQSRRLENLRDYREIVTFSDHMRREYLSHGFSPTHVHRLPPVDPMATVDAAEARDDATLARRPSETIVHHLTFIGRIERLKGCHTLITALGRLRSRLPGRPILTIAGDGPDLERCREAARQLTAAGCDAEVRFLGWVSEAHLDALLRATDVLVVPSLWPEPFGLVGMEALRRGVPVAAFNVGAIPEWLEDGKTGVLAPSDPPTPDGLAEAIANALSSPGIRETVQSRARRGLPDCSIARHMDALRIVLTAAAFHGQQQPDRVW